MNCAWCGANDDGSDSHGICDACMALYFDVNPAKVHAEMAAESNEEQTATCLSQASRSRGMHFQCIQKVALVVAACA